MGVAAAPLRLGTAEIEFYSTAEAAALLASPERLGDWLASGELRALSAFPAPKRRRDWLAARLAAKRLVGRRLAEAGAPRPAPEIRILNAPSREPFVALGASDAPNPSLPISLSHASDHGACALGRPGTLVGLDLERVEARAPSWRELMADGSELTPELMASPEQLTRLWSAKEAVLKLLGLGLSIDLHTVRPAEDGTVRLLGAAAARWAERGRRPIRVHFTRYHDCCLSVAIACSAAAYYAPRRASKEKCSQGGALGDETAARRDH